MLSSAARLSLKFSFSQEEGCRIVEAGERCSTRNRLNGTGNFEWRRLIKFLIPLLNIARLSVMRLIRFTLLFPPSFRSSFLSLSLALFLCSPRHGCAICCAFCDAMLDYRRIIPISVWFSEFVSVIVATCSFGVNRADTLVALTCPLFRYSCNSPWLYLTSSLH